MLFCISDAIIYLV